MTTETIRKIFTRDFILGFFSQFIFATTLNILIPTLPIFLSRLESNETEIGVLVGAFSVSSLILRPFVGRILSRIPERTFMIAGSLLFGLTSAAYLVAPPFWPFFVVRILQGIGHAFFYPSLIVYVIEHAGASRGLAMGTFTAISDLGLCLGPVMTGLIIHFAGYPTMFLCLSFVGVLNLGYFLFFLKDRGSLSGHA